MLTSPIKPPLPSASPSPALSFCSFFPLRHLNLSAASRETSGSLTPPPSPCFLPRQPCGHSIVCRSANTGCISCTCVHYQKNSKRTAPPIACCNASRDPLCYDTDVSRGVGLISPFLRVHLCWSGFSFFLIVHALNHMRTFDTNNFSQLLLPQLLCVYRIEGIKV